MNIYVVKENYIDLYKNEDRQFIYTFEKLSGATSLIEDMKNKSFALEHKFEIYKFEFNNNFRMKELEKELGL